MKKKVIKAEPQGNGTLFTYADGQQEFIEGITATLNQQMDDSKVDAVDADEESLLAQMRK